jgi:hypothetical protein
MLEERETKFEVVERPRAPLDETLSLREPVS